LKQFIKYTITEKGLYLRPYVPPSLSYLPPSLPPSLPQASLKMTVSMNLLVKWAMQTAEGIKHLHKAGVIHRYCPSLLSFIPFLSLVSARLPS